MGERSKLYEGFDNRLDNRKTLGYTGYTADQQRSGGFKTYFYYNNAEKRKKRYQQEQNCTGSSSNFYASSSDNNNRCDDKIVPAILNVVNMKSALSSSQSQLNTSGRLQQDSTMFHIFSEDLRISKILRRLCAETNPITANELCEKLKVVVMDAANATYIRRSFDFLAESIISVLHQGPIECLDNVSEVFGMMGYVIKNDFPIYKNWIVRTYEQSKDIRCYLIKSLKITIKMDSDNLDLVTYSDRLLGTLKDWLECADVFDDFKAVSEVIAECSKIYKKHFEKHFTDIVDIIIGWHLETEQSLKLKRHCSFILQQFSEFFIKKFDFTLSLLGQFLEDITAFGEDTNDVMTIGDVDSQQQVAPISSSSSSFDSGGDGMVTSDIIINKSTSSSSSDISVGSFIGAFVSVMKCLATDRELIAFKLDKNLFNESIRIITKISYQSLKRTIALQSLSSSSGLQLKRNSQQQNSLAVTQQTIQLTNEIIQSVNEFFIIILSLGLITAPSSSSSTATIGIGIGGGSCNLIEYDAHKIFEVIKIEIEFMNLFNNSTTIQIDCILYSLILLCKSLKTKISVDMISFIMNTKLNKKLQIIKFTSNRKHYKLMIKLYHEILKIKNVQLLQEAYKHILIDMKLAMKSLNTEEDSSSATEKLIRNEIEFSYSTKQAECVLNFYFSTLTILATETSSIIGMYALQPSILELLNNELDSTNLNMWLRYPVLYDALITLLSVHCLKNHNYILSSNLLMVTTNVFSKHLPLNNQSPTSENFTIILQFFVNILTSKRILQLTEKTLSTLLDWIYQLYYECIQHENFLYTNFLFIKIQKLICLLSIKSTNCKQSKNFIKKYGKLILLFLKYSKISKDVLNLISEICCIQILSTNTDIKNLYTKIFGQIPIGVTIKQHKNQNGLFSTRENELNELQHWYFSTSFNTTASGSVDKLSHQKIKFKEKHFGNFIDQIKIRNPSLPSTLVSKLIISREQTTPRDNEQEDYYSLATTTTTSSSSTEDSISDISNNYNLIGKFVKEIFPKCWINYRVNDTDKYDMYFNQTQLNWDLLVSWLQWELAKYCVNNKLRTLIGKPQETFVKIETIVKEYARQLAMKAEQQQSSEHVTTTDSYLSVDVDDTNVKIDNHQHQNQILFLLENQENAKVLLGFIEYLEKLIYNASEGTAFAISAPDKPIRTFFRVNILTCNEWFNRIRTAMNLIALNTMQPEIIIRNSEIILQMLIKSNCTTELLFENTLVTLVWALLRNCETETLHGLYVWIKKMTSKRILWIKYAAEQAAGHREKAVEGYMNIISTTENLEINTREFLIEQIIECLYYTNQWKEIKEIILKEYTIVGSNQKFTMKLTNLTLPHIYNVCNLELKEINNLLSSSSKACNYDNLIDWNLLNTCTTATNSTIEMDHNSFDHQNFNHYMKLNFNNFSCYNLMYITEKNLINALNYHKTSCITSDDDNNSKILQELKLCSNIITSGLQQCLILKSKNYLNIFITLNYVLNYIYDMYEQEDLKNDKIRTINNTQDSIIEKLLNSIQLMLDTKTYNTCTLIYTLNWLKIIQPKIVTISNFDKLNLQIIKLSRKEGNLKFCESELEKFFKRKNIELIDDLIVTNVNNDNNEPKTYETYCKKILEMNNMWSKDILTGIHEICKCWYLTNDLQKQDMAIQILSSCCVSVLSLSSLSQQSIKSAEVKEYLAKMLLTLSDWFSLFQHDHNSTLNLFDNDKPTKKLLMILPDIKSNINEKINTTSSIPILDISIGKLLQSSTEQYTNLAKSWNSLGNWFYRWGRKIFELRSTTNTTTTTTGSGGNGNHQYSEKIKLCLNDIEEIKKIIPKESFSSTGTTISTTNIDEIVKILNRHQVNVIDDDEIGVSNGDLGLTELIENQLREIEILRHVDSAVILSIIQIWKKAQKNIYVYYEMAADAYFKYLNLASSSMPISSSSYDKNNRKTMDDDHVNYDVIVNDGSDTLNSSEITNDSSVVTATLRLLRLVVKHAIGLQDVLEHGLSTTPTKPWKVIIPQLFSRLNHHETYVRKRVSELLCRVAEDSPHLVIFPAVVGAIQEKIDDNDDEIGDGENENEDYEGNRKISKSSINVVNPLINCFNSLLNILSKQAKETVQQVEMLVKELKRVTLLWDEYWLHSLAQLYSEYSEIFNEIEYEVRNTTSTVTSPLSSGLVLMAGEEDSDDSTVPVGDIRFDTLNAKYDKLMYYITKDLEKLYKHTARTPETNYERNFIEKYSKIIEMTINELKFSKLNPQKPNESWQKIKQLYAMFQQKLQKNSQSILKMQDISPVLANMQNTTISMPGIEIIPSSSVTSVKSHQIYIRSIDNLVHILPTKTKPKKLAFYGNDGKRYTYLFKGLEDLHLDERIMQFLSISNSMMSKSRDAMGNLIKYHAHHYSVIPLGPRSGLISWVDGVTPIFALYKKWQQREAANPRNLNKDAVGNSSLGGAVATHNNTTTVMRPSEMFYNKLTPLLAEHGIKITDDRKTWPIEVLRKVLNELTKETPSDLLAKEIWCCSNNPAQWRESVRTYSLSAAVMSVIGYVIGLGDRHLDNVLIKLSTGDIVHIDYNVCFEKGKTLRVPERVPFRMTPNLETALGVTGIEGIFRLTCEHVLKILRRERETLLTLLEAFIYDPLVDWAMSDDGTTVTVKSTKAQIAAAEIAKIEREIKNKSTSGEEGAKGHGISEISLIGNTIKSSSENEGIRSLLGMKSNSIQIKWEQYKIEINSLLSQIISSCEEYERQQQKIKDSESQRNLLSRQLAMIREVETLRTAISSHPLNTLSQRYSQYKIALDELTNYKIILTEKQKEYEMQYQAYITLISKFKVPEIQKLQCDLQQFSPTQLQIEENEYNFGVILNEILENTGQNDLCTQLDQSYKELNVSFIQQSFMMKICLDAIEQYLNVMKFIPKSKLLLQDHRLLCYATCLKKILESPDCYEEVLKIYKSSLSNNETKDDERRKSIDDGNSNDGGGDFIDSTTSEKVISYIFEMNKIRNEIDLNLRQKYNLSQNELIDYNEQFLNETQIAIGIFIQSDDDIRSHRTALQNEFALFISDLINNFIINEQSIIANAITSSSSSSSPIEILSMNLNSGLNQMQLYLSYMIESIKLIFDTEDEVFTEELKNFYNLMQLALKVIQSFCDFENLYQTEIIPKAIHVFMMLDCSNLDINRALDKIISTFDMKSLDFIAKKLKNDDDITNWCDDDSDIEQLKVVFDTNIKQIDDDEFIALISSIEQSFTTILTNFQIYYELFKCCPRDKTFDGIVIREINLNFLLKYFDLIKYRIISHFVLITKQMTDSLKENKNLYRIFDLRIIIQETTTSFLNDCIKNLFAGHGSYASALFTIKLIQSMMIIDDCHHNSNDNIHLINLKTAKNYALLIIEQNILNGKYLPETYSYAKSICSNYNLALKKQYRIDELKRQIYQQTTILNYFDLIMSGYIWINEKYFIEEQKQSLPTFSYLTSKKIILQNIQQSKQNLTIWNISIKKIKDELQNYMKTMGQHLKWCVNSDGDSAVATIDDDLNHRFYEFFTQLDIKYHDLMDVSINLLKLCKTIENFEENIIGQKNKEEQQEFLCLLQQFNQICINYKLHKNHITIIEEGIIELLDPEGPIDHYWINNITELLNEMTDNIQRKIVNLEKDQQILKESIQMIYGQKLKSLINNEIHVNTKLILKSIYKIEDNGSSTLNTSQIITEFKKHRNLYRQLLNHLTDLQMKILTKNLTKDNIENIQNLAKKLLNEIDDFYTELIRILNYNDNKNKGLAITRRTLLNRRTGNDYYSGDGMESQDTRKATATERKTEKSNRKGNQIEQKRNAYAISVWRRIRMKLEGRDPDYNYRQTIPEQIDWMIHESMNLDNLALLYEGWTPWV